MNIRPYIQNIRPFFDSFWSRSPALFYALFLYLGAVAALSWHIALLVPFALLLVYKSQEQKWRLLLGVLASGLFYLFASSSVVYPPTWADSIEGVATFECTDMVHEARYGRSYCKFKINLLSFEASDNSFYAKNVPCKFVWNNPGSRPSADTRYFATATLHEHEGNWTLKLAKDAFLQKLDSTYSLVEWRLWAKSRVKLLLATYLPPGQTRAFLEGVLIGEFHDPYLSASLARFGLQHITVVSGFHFSLIAIILAAFFRLILPWKFTNICLLIAITAYLLFIGPSPSVLRAWISVSIMFLGKILERTSNGMNCLGLGLITVLVWDPACVFQLGFSLSFLATFAILLLYPLVDHTIRMCFPKRSAHEILKMPFSEQLLFVVLSFFISSLALVISVSILMLPMSLYCFQQFPVMGIIYNCFFPFLVSVAVLIVCIAFLFLWCAPIAAVLFAIAAYLLESALTLITYAPSWCDIMLRATCISAFWLVVYLCGASTIGICLYEQRRLQRD